jgi:hypothetical protein
MRANPNDRYTEYVRNFQGRQERPITTMPVTPPSDEINHYGIDEYGRGAGEGFGTAPPPGMGMAGIGMNFPGLDGTRIPGEGPGLFGNTTGIASLAEGGYPRRNGQISGPGTEKSDSIPAMLSDGEFVMTAKAVRGAGKGSRRAGAKQMYKLMHQLEKNAERG